MKAPLAMACLILTGCGTDEPIPSGPYVAPNIVWVSIHNNTPDERLCSLSTTWSDGEREFQYILANETPIAAGSGRRGDPRVGVGGTLTIEAQCSLPEHVDWAFVRRAIPNVPDRCDIRADYSVSGGDARMDLTLTECGE